MPTLIKTIPLTLLAAAVLSACSLAPNAQRPAAPVPDAYPTQAAERAGDASSIGWREFFPEPQLQTLIATALENNRDLRASALRIEEARALYNIQAADLLPTLNGTASGARSRTPAGLSPTGAAVTGSSYQVGLSLASYELDFFGRVRSLSNAALAQYLASEEASRSVRISLVAEVAKAYLSVRAFDEQIVLARQTLEGREQGYQLAKQRFDVGASSALDLRLNETLVLSARTALVTLTRQRAQALNALNVLLGKQVTDLPPGPLLADEKIVTGIPAGLPSDLLTRRPDIRAAEQRLLAANANIGAARAAFFPRIALTASAGTASNALSDLFTAGTQAWTFAPQLVLPLFDAGRNRANLKLAQVRNNIAVADYEKTIQVAFREVADALAARATLDAQIEAQRATQEAQADRLRLSEQRFQNGVASSLDVLDAQRELFSAQQALIQARLLKLTNAIDLYRALGGGMVETAPAS